MSNRPEPRNRFEVGQKTAIEFDARQRDDLGFLEMDAMAEQRARAEQAIARVDVEIGLGPGELALDEGDLGEILAQVRLHVGVAMFARQRAGGLQLRFARGDGEARRDGVFEPPAPAPALNQRLALVVAALRRIGERYGRVAIHHHLAGDHARAAPFALGEERVDRLGVDGAIDARRRRALAEQLVEEEARHRLAVAEIGEFLLLDEGVFLQPIEKLRAVGADDAGLGIMDVRVDEAGHDELARPVVDRGARRRAA